MGMQWEVCVGKSVYTFGTLAASEAVNEFRAFFTAEQGRRHAGSRSRLNNRPVSTASCLSGDMRGKKECPCDSNAAATAHTWANKLLPY